MLFEPNKIRKPNLGICDLFLVTGQPVRHLECPDYEIHSPLLHRPEGHLGLPGYLEANARPGALRQELEVLSRLPDTKYPIFCSGCGRLVGRAGRRLLKHGELPETLSNPKKIKTIICGHMWVRACKINSHDTVKLARIKQDKGSFMTARWALTENIFDGEATGGRVVLSYATKREIQRLRASVS